MVLGIVTGSVPMLFSLMLMQGITLTMWRSFLDKAIPRYNGQQWRKNFEQAIMPLKANSPSTAASGMTAAEAIAQLQMPTSLQQQPSSSSIEASTAQPAVSNPILNSLHLLSSLDPTIITLLNQLQTKVRDQSGDNTNLAANSALQSLLLNSPGNQALSSPGLGGIDLQQQLLQQQLLQQQQQGTGMLYASEGISENSNPPYTQFNSNVDPGQVKYIEVPADEANQANSENLPPTNYDDSQLQQQQQYVYEQPGQDETEQEIDTNYQYETQPQQQNSPNNNEEEQEGRYEYLEDPSQTALARPPKTEQIAEQQFDEPDAFVRQAAESSQMEIREKASERRVPKSKKSVRKNMPHVIIGPPIPGAAFSSKLRVKKGRKMYHDSQYDIRKWARLSSKRKMMKKKKKIVGRMFGKPHSITKRMLSEETTIWTTRRPPKRSGQGRSWSTEVRPIYRFATPSYPRHLISPTVSRKDIRHSFKAIGNGADSQFQSSNDDHISVKMTDKTQNLKLKSKKIRLIEIEEEKNNNCTSDQKMSKGKFTLLWSQKTGWPRGFNNCTISIDSNNKTAPQNVSDHHDDFRERQQNSTSKLLTEPSKEQVNEKTINSETTKQRVADNEIFNPSVTSMTATISAETTTTATASEKQSDLAAITSTSSTAMATPNTLIINLTNFLSSLTTPAPNRITTITAPSTTIASTITSSATIPSTTLTSLTSPEILVGTADQLPKEFLHHVLLAINVSKIEDYQIGSRNNNEHATNRPTLQVETNTGKTTESSMEPDTEREEEDVDNQVDWKQVDTENRIDGKNPANHRFKRVCYYLLDGGRDGQLDISELELHICSHLIVGYARISTDGLVVAERPLEDSEKYRRLTLMKLQYPNLKVLISVGDLGGGTFSIVASSNRTRERFIESILDYCDEFGFDGVDIDWEFPSFRTGYREDKTNFVILLEGLRNRANQIWKPRFRFNKASGPNTNSKFITSVAVGAPLIIASTSYIIPAIAKVVDFCCLMSYDFHYYRPDRPYTGHHSPLYPRSVEQAYYSTLNVAWAATFWANKGMPLHKIIVGVPTYARTFNLVVPVGQNMNSPANGPGLGRGKINYSEVCAFLKLPGATKQFDIYSQVPFAYRNYDWISYENEMSVAIKAQWAVKTGMGGIVTFALNFDDFKGTCRDDRKKFPLQKVISNLLELASIKSYKRSSYIMKIRY